MPSLSPEDQTNLLGPVGGDKPFKCPTCNKVYYRNYCRSCDEFFFECDCPREDHLNCRTY